MIDMLECIDPKAVTNSDYMAFLDGQGRPEFVAHYALCPFCRQEVASYQKLDNLVQLNFRFTLPAERLARMCLEPQTLGEYNLGLLETLENKRVAAHLSVCEFCTTELNLLQKWLPELDLVAPPVTRPEPKVGLWTKGWLRRVEAALRSLGQPQSGLSFAGVRGAGLDTGVALDGMPQVYEAEEVQVTVSIETNGPRRRDVTVMGQVLHDSYLPDDLKGLEVRLFQGTEAVAIQEIDDAGYFVFENLAPIRQFGLELTMPDKVVVISTIQVN